MVPKVPIDKGIPFPNKVVRRGGKVEHIYPWAKMQVGDSFLFPPHVMGSAYASARLATNRFKGRLFKVSKTAEGYRCWRLE